MLGCGSRGDKGRGLMPINVGSRQLMRVLEAEPRKLERPPLNRQVTVAVTRHYLGSRLKMDAHRSSLRPFGVHEYWPHAWPPPSARASCQTSCHESEVDRAPVGAPATARLRPDDLPDGIAAQAGASQRVR